MKIRDRMKAAVEAFRAKSTTTSGGSMTLNQLLEFLGVHNVEGSALSEATYFACLKVLSESIGKLPLKIQQATPNNGIRVARDHQYYRMLNERPNRHMTASIFWGAMELCRNHYGNAYAYIDTTDPRHPQLWPLEPDRVTVYYDNTGKLSDAPDVYYQYSANDGPVILGSEDVLHFKSHHTREGLVGISVREQLHNTIQGNIKAQAVVNDIYDGGMTSAAVLQYTGSLDDKKTETLVAGVEKYLKNRGKDKGVARVLPIPVGSTLTPLNMKLTDSQFLEMKQYTALQIASAFGVKPYQVGDYTKSSYASAEAQQLSFLIDTLLYIVKQYEEEIGYKLLTDNEEANGYHVKFNTAVLLRADFKSQIESLSLAVSSFLYKIGRAHV